MRAIRYHDYGVPPAIDQVAIPEIGPTDVLVRVEAAALNPLDVKLHSGRMQWYFDLTLPYTMGSDLAGTVQAVGDRVTAHRPGDRVIGRRPPLLGGAFADLVVVPGCDCVRLPVGMAATRGAAIPTAAGTAHSALFDVAGLTAGQSVLIHAGAGGVGSFAVQFAKRAAAHVVATASGDGIGLVRGFGADEVIDYRSQDFTAGGRRFDVVLDTVGFETLDRSFAVVKPGGHLASVVMPPDENRARAAGIDATRVYYSLQPGALADLIRRVVDQDIRILMDCEVPVERFAEALARQASGRAKGKIVLDFGG